jgi:hypothetical protein
LVFTAPFDALAPLRFVCRAVSAGFVPLGRVCVKTPPLGQSFVTHFVQSFIPVLEISFVQRHYHRTTAFDPSQV